MKYLIIGAGAAAISAAESIRSVDKAGSITMLSAESVIPYGKPLISYLLSEKLSENKMFYRPQSFYKRLNIDIKLGSEVSKIDTKRKIVTTRQNKKYGYEKLLIASGSVPFVPPIGDLAKQKNAFTFLTYGDMKKIKAAVNKESNVVIAGAGLVGLKAAEGLYGKVKNITVIDLADRIMASVLDEEPAKIIQNHIESKGISFKFGVSIKSVRGKKITLSNGKDLPCDILVIAVGVRPGIAFLEGSGVKVEKGIVVDKNMQTSVKSVYAAGDCALSTDMLSKQKKVMALWPNAVLQGQVAGLNMADVKSEAADALSMNAISFFGMQVMSAGIQEPKAHYLKNTKNALSRLKVNKDILEGFTLINNVARAGIYTDLIKNKTSLSALTYDIKIKDIALGVYPFETRRKKLFGGGAQ